MYNIIEGCVSSVVFVIIVIVLACWRHKLMKQKKEREELLSTMDPFIVEKITCFEGHEL